MDDAKTVMRKVIERWDARDRDGLLTLTDEAVRFVDEPSGREFVGREEFTKVHFDRWTEAYPDHELKDRVLIAEGDLVCFEARFVGTHTGTYRFPGMKDMPPTGKTIDGPFVFIAEIRDGKIRSARHFYDRLRVLEEEEVLTVDALLAQLPVG